jgi:hypothetical protein
LLQIDDIVAPQHGCTPIEEAVTHAKTGFDQRAPGLGAADAIDAESSQVLKCLNGCTRPVAEDSVSVDERAAMEYGGQPPLHIGNSRPLVSEGKGQTYRYAAISWSN